tara:strand:- start:398 stop:1387 length:990 start_codon:yes stop_codon:yes gene_type:complete
MLNILYLCDKNVYDTKMSRVRFHGMRAIGKHTDVNLTWSGPGWPKYNKNKSVSKNIENICKDIKPDLVVAYKPLNLIKFRELDIPKCLRYNEMYDVDWTNKEIIDTKSNLIICHHENDMNEYKKMYSMKRIDHTLRFYNIPHAAEKIIYRDYGMPKKYDVLLAGAVFTKSLLGDHYPLRIRLARDILPKMSKKYKCNILQHPGGNLYNASSDQNSFYYAQQLSSAKICVTCSGVPKSRFGKYIEIPMCGTAIAADMPGEQQEQFKEFMIEINMSMTDEEIINKLSHYLDNEEELNKITTRGMKYAENHTQEKYAESFVNIVKEYLEETQ